jgi:ribosomal protein L29
VEVVDPEIWPLLDRVIQWLVIPAIGAWWMLSREVSRHATTMSEGFGKHDKEILRILTILEERNGQRQEDRAHVADALEKLDGTLRELRKEIASMRGRAP